MTRRVRPHGDGIRLALEAWEADLLRRLRDGLRARLAEGDPEDPVIARLFPPAVEDDDEADAELRTLIGADLLLSRLEGLDAVVEILERGEGPDGRVRVDLDADEAPLLLGVVNDLRLALGVRVGIEDIERQQLDDDDPRVPTLAIMDHLAGLQEEILAVLDPTSLSFYDDLGRR